MKEGAFIADHVNEFDSILSRLMSIKIKFDDEVHALFLLFLLPESWSATFTAKGHFQNQCSKPVTSRDKEVNMADGDFGNALRLGYMSEKGMKILALKGRILDGACFYEPCVLRKQKKVDPATMLPLSMIAAGRYEFIFLTNNSEVFNTFKKWEDVVENETNHRVKCLKSDNGGEYSNKEFIDYCFENEIGMLKTIPETPQQNVVAERINQTLNDKARRFQIQEEEWKGKEVSLAHLKVFRCDSYVKVKDVTRDKLDTKAMKAQVRAQIQVRGPKTVKSSRIVEIHMKKALKTEHTSKRGALRLHRKGSLGSCQVASMLLEREGYKRCVVDYCCYLKKISLSSIVLLLYVDDMLVAGSDMAKMKKLKIDCVMYAMVWTRPDIAHAVGVVSIFMSNLGKEHWEAVKWLLCYLKDYRGCLDSDKSTTCYVFIVGGIVVSWMSKIQKHVAMPTIEAEYMAIAQAGKEFIRYHYILELVSEGTLSLMKILGVENPTSMLTKVVTTEKLKLCAASTGL
nr:retrovirus-related Pol polyprotein from transposon TNT 1-94 [Tanacetum cinerariifolium]